MVQVAAEWGQSCRGSLSTAIAQAAVAKEAGCAFSKWQTFKTERLVSRTAPRYWSSHLGGAATQAETFNSNGMLPPEAWKDLAEACREIGVGFLSSPFDLESVDLLVEAGAEAFKLASGEIAHKQLLERVAETRLPVFLSTGASTWEEISAAVRWLHPCEITFLACSLAYPCPDEEANLGRIATLAGRYERVGYSDHTTRTDTALAAVVAGAVFVEKHCTLNADGGVPDDRMALEPARLRQYVAYAQLGEKMRGDGILAPSFVELEARAGARRSLHAATNIPAGKTLQVDDFVCLRPGGPFAPADVDVVAGRTAARDIPAGKQLESADVVF